MAAIEVGVGMNCDRGASNSFNGGGQFIFHSLVGLALPELTRSGLVRDDDLTSSISSISSKITQNW